MTGLLVLALFGLWIWAVFKFSRWVGGQVQGGRWRWPIAALVFALLLPLPVADEIVANRQLEALCREGAVMKLDEAKLRGRRVKVASEPLDAEVPSVAIPTTYSRLMLRDAETGEEMGSRGSYRVKGGVLIHALGISESNSPTFARSGCAPSEGVYEAAKRIGFTIIKQLGEKDAGNQ